MTEPKLLLLDEPLSAIDSQVRQALQKELKKIQRTWKIPFVLVTHSHKEMEALADEVFFLKEGKTATFANGVLSLGQSSRQLA
jgi:molybdate transport system ATP-binding protein